MTRSIVLFTLMIATITSANAQKLEFIKGPEIRNDEKVWTYSVIRPQSKKPLTVQLTLSDFAHVRGVISAMEATLQQKRLETENLVQLTFTPTDTSTFENQTEDQTFTFEVIASKSVIKNGEINWTIEATPNINGTVPGPSILYDSSVDSTFSDSLGALRSDSDDTRIVQKEQDEIKVPNERQEAYPTQLWSGISIFFLYIVLVVSTLSLLISIISLLISIGVPFFRYIKKIKRIKWILIAVIVVLAIFIITNLVPLDNAIQELAKEEWRTIIAFIALLVSIGVAWSYHKKDKKLQNRQHLFEIRQSKIQSLQAASPKNS